MRWHVALLSVLCVTLLVTGSVQAARWNATRLSFEAVPALPRSVTQPTTLAQSPAAVASHAVDPRQLLDRYCVACHNEKLKTAGLVLDQAGADVGRIAQDAELWERVIAKLRSGAMPPSGRPRPDEPTMTAFISHLETTIDTQARANPNPGRPAVHRLNRAEYANAVRDVLGLEIDATAYLPPDDSGYGFDNIADVLTMSPALFDRYLSAANRIARLAVGFAPTRPGVDVFMVPEGVRQEDRASEDLPFGTRGGIAVRRYFPVAGKYEVTIRMKTAVGQNELIGATRETPVELRLDGRVVERFTFGRDPSKAKGASSYERGTYYGGGDIPDHYIFRIQVPAGSHVVGVTFPHATLEREDLSPWFPTADYSFLNESDDPPRIESVEVGGPYDVEGPGETLSRRKIFICRPSTENDELGCATKILTNLAELAYRGPVKSADIEPLMAVYRAGRGEGTFERGIQDGIERMLLSPRFLFRIETGGLQGASARPAPRAYHISELELASRLSFFLWSSVPDAQLLDLAKQGRLRQPGVLEAQVRRMVADPRSSALVANFAGQWLRLRDLQNSRPDFREFPEFDDEMRVAFRRETEMLFESQLREDRSIVDLLRADYTFVNERLAKMYGIPNVYGSHMRRVPVTDANRIGLLGHASILTLTSYANRTSPVLRGKWVLETILGAPPPAPPPDVPPLEESGNVKFASMRERMDAHRRNPTCAACHARIDPLGFALDNFDGIGKWRTREGQTPVDASGSLDGSKFNGVAELRKLLLERDEAFATAVTKKMLTYALGRGAEYYDMPAVRGILADSAPEYRWSSVILGIIESVPFQMRSAQ
jgi:cytochrome c5